MLDFTDRIDEDMIVDGAKRVALARKQAATSDPRAGLMTSWRQQNRYWGLRTILFEHATGVPYGEVIAALLENPVRGNDPTNEEAARTRAIRDLSDASMRGRDIPELVFENWSRWSFFPDIIRDVFEVDPEEMRIAVEAFDNAIARAVIDYEPKYQERIEEEARRWREVYNKQPVRAPEEKTQQPAAPSELPDIYRLSAHWSGAGAELRFAATSDDLRGHPELLHPILSGIWKLLIPWSARGGMSADYRAGTLSVKVDSGQLDELMASTSILSEGIWKILDLDRDLTPLLSETKAISILQVSRDEFRELADIGEISPWRTLRLKSGPAAGKEFMGYTPLDILELRDRLHAG